MAKKQQAAQPPDKTVKQDPDEAAAEVLDLPQRDALSVLDPGLVGGALGAVISPSPLPIDPSPPDGLDAADPSAAELKPAEELTSDSSKLGNVTYVPPRTNPADA